jgi:hypothetical protein
VITAAPSVQASERNTAQLGNLVKNKEGTIAAANSRNPETSIPKTAGIAPLLPRYTI